MIYAEMGSKGQQRRSMALSAFYRTFRNNPRLAEYDHIWRKYPAGTALGGTNWAARDAEYQETLNAAKKNGHADMATLLETYLSDLEKLPPMPRW